MKHFLGTDIAVVIPTKDRPIAIQLLLDSLVSQSISFGRILVVDSGEPIDFITTKYVGCLPLEYYRSARGQVRQRKLGISLLDESTPLVATIDDDLCFEENAFLELLKVFNSSFNDVAGVGFNHRNAPPNRYFLLRRLFFMSSKNPGLVTLAGYNTPIAQANENLRTSWLGGGYTVWKLSVLRQFEQEEVSTSWAVGEDVRFSYKVGRVYQLVVASKAGFVEQRHPPQVLRQRSAFYRGIRASAALYYFVRTNPELSRLACAWMLFGRMCGSVLIGMFKCEAWRFHYALGHLFVLASIPGDFLGLFSIKKFMED